MSDIPADTLARLSGGEWESANLMEWLATDMSELARTVASGMPRAPLRDSLCGAAEEMRGKGVTVRLQLIGGAIAQAVPDLASLEFEFLARHRSDLVRQWACYAANNSGLPLTLDRRLRETKRFAADPNMSVREAAWMAFRPHLALNLDVGIRLLEPLS